MDLFKGNYSIIIIGIYIYILFNHIKNDDYYMMGILTLITGAILYKLKSNTIEGLEEDDNAPADAPADQNPVLETLGGVEETARAATPGAVDTFSKDQSEYEILRDKARTKKEGGTKEGEKKDDPVAFGDTIEGDGTVTGKKTTEDKNFEEKTIK